MAKWSRGGNQCRWYRRRPSRLGCVDGWRRPCDRAVFPLTRRPRYWWGRDAPPGPARPGMPGPVSARWRLSPRRIAASSPGNKLWRAASKRRRRRRLRLPVWRHMMNRKSMSTSGRRLDRYLPLKSHVTGSRVTSIHDLFWSGDDVDTSRVESQAARRRLYNIHAPGRINHCAPAPEKMSIWKTYHSPVRLSGRSDVELYGGVRAISRWFITTNTRTLVKSYTGMTYWRSF